ncbi:hypothetical protein MCEMSEM23_01147 [Rhabdaerophilaceae bacterium]
MTISAEARRAKLAASATLARKSRFKDAEMVLSDLLEELPGDLEVFGAVAAVALGQGDSTRAKSFLGEILRVEPNRADILATLAQAHRLEDNLAAAATCLRRAVDCGGSALHRAALAEILLLQKEGLQANAEVGLALRTCPDDYAVRMVAGMAAIAVGEPQVAVEHFEHANRLAPDQPEPLNNLAELAARKGDDAAALAHSEAAYLIEPADPDLAASYAAKLLAKGAIARADSVLQRALATQPAHFGLLRLRAEKRLAAGETQAAIAEFAGYVSRSRRPEAVRALAALLRKAGRHAQALALLRELLKPDAPEPGALAEAIDLALCAGDFTTARSLGFSAKATLDAVHVDGTIMSAHSAGEVILLAQMLLGLDSNCPVTLHADEDIAQLAALVPGLHVRPLSAKPADSVPLPVILPVWIGVSENPAEAVVRLEAEPLKVQAWQLALSEHARPAIGLVYAEHLPGLSLGELASVLNSKGTLVSLAVGAEREALAAFPDVLDAGAHIHSPADLAAAIVALDLVVGVDALALSLAGGLGRPGVVIVEQAGTWLWASQNGEACWHPSITVVPFGRGQPIEPFHQRLAYAVDRRFPAVPALHSMGE